MAVRRKLSAEAAIKRDLARMPPHLRTGGLGTVMLMLARRFDSGISARDSCLVARELRCSIAALYQLAPYQLPGDPVDELRARRESRLTGG
jgi:hypothetical protein